MIEDNIRNVESELRNSLSKTPVKNVYFADVLPAEIEVPTVQCILRSTEETDLGYIQPNKKHWNLNYEVLVFGSGAEGNQSYLDARDIVNKVYHYLQRERKPDRRLNGECIDINCPSIQYGEAQIGIENGMMVYGGLINLTITITETNVTE